jgi:ABC-type multidrug transport system fused ATPase/permease subunit
VYASGRVARDLRTQIVAKLSTQSLAYIQRVTTATILTNLTSDVDAVKVYVSQAVGSIVSSIFVIVGASILLLSIDWKLGLAVIAVLPIIGVAFQVVFRRVRKLFATAQQAIDRAGGAEHGRGQDEKCDALCWKRVAQHSTSYRDVRQPGDGIRGGQLPHLCQAGGIVVGDRHGDRGETSTRAR